MDNTQQIPGEATISPQQIGQQVPEIQTPQGASQLHQKLAGAMQAKQMLDFLFRGIADHFKADFSSRVKNPQTAAAKVAQKRMQGRKYSINDINDALGLRISVDRASQIPEVKKMIQKLNSMGVIKIDKSQAVREGNYNAYHYDIDAAGTQAELQLHTKNSELESVANHPLRSLYGEKPPESVKTLQDAQAQIAAKLPSRKASQISGALKQIQQQNPNQPTDPRIIASILAAKGGE